MKTPQMLSNEQIQIGKQISFDIKQADIDRKKNVISNFKTEGQKIHSKVLPLSDKYGCYPKASLDLDKPAHQNAFIGEMISMVNGKITNGLWLTITLFLAAFLVISMFVSEVYFMLEIWSHTNYDAIDGSHKITLSSFMMAIGATLVTSIAGHHIANHMTPSLLKIVTWLSAIICVIALCRNYSMLASFIDHAANGANVNSILDLSSGDTFEMQRFGFSNVAPLVLLPVFIGMYSQTIKTCLFEKILNKERKADSEVLAEQQAMHTKLITEVELINDEIELALQKDISVVASILHAAFSSPRPLTLKEQATVSWVSQSTDDPIVKHWVSIIQAKLPTQWSETTETCDITQVEALLHDQLALLTHTQGE